MSIIFVDTNIFLHFKNFTEIDWLEICHDVNCKVVIAPIVIDELDKLKISNDDKGKRARKVLLKFEECDENNQSEIRKNVDLEVILDRPKKITFNTNHLNPQEQDHQLMACIIEYKLREKSNTNEIFLCSNDIGPRLRSKQFGIRVLKLPNEYLLPEKDNAIEKQLKTLLKENALLKSRIPQPILVFKNEKDFVKIKISENEINKEFFINLELIKLKNDYPYMEIDLNDEKYMNPIAPISIINTISQDQMNKYNSNLDEFYTDYASYLDSLYYYERKSNHSINIDLCITNRGNVPAEDVDIYCHFPDGFELIGEDDLEDPPEKPNPPSTPKTFFENFADISSSINLRPFSHDLGTTIIPKLNRPSIKKTSSYEVHLFRKYIKHGIVYSLDRLVAIYGQFSDMKSFAIDYRIIAGNIPETIEGKVNIIFEK